MTSPSYRLKHHKKGKIIKLVYICCVSLKHDYIHRMPPWYCWGIFSTEQRNTLLPRCDLRKLQEKKPWVKFLGHQLANKLIISYTLIHWTRNLYKLCIQHMYVTTLNFCKYYGKNAIKNSTCIFIFPLPSTNTHNHKVLQHCTTISKKSVQLRGYTCLMSPLCS